MRGGLRLAGVSVAAVLSKASARRLRLERLVEAGLEAVPLLHAGERIDVRVSRHGSSLRCSG